MSDEPTFTFPNEISPPNDEATAGAVLSPTNKVPEQHPEELPEDLLDTSAEAASRVLALEAFLTLINQDLPFTDFMRELLGAIMRAVPSEAGSILEIDERARCLFFRVAVGTSSERLEHFRVPLGQGIVGYVAESRQPLAVDDAGSNQVHLKSIQEAVGFKARNIVALPLVIRGRVFGVLELINRITDLESDAPGGADSGYNPSVVENLVYLTNQAAKAIEARMVLGWALGAGSAKTPSESEAA